MVQHPESLSRDGKLRPIAITRESFDCRPFVGRHHRGGLVKGPAAESSPDRELDDGGCVARKCPYDAFLALPGLVRSAAHDANEVDHEVERGGDPGEGRLRAQRPAHRDHGKVKRPTDECFAGTRVDLAGSRLHVDVAISAVRPLLQPLHDHLHPSRRLHRTRRTASGTKHVMSAGSASAKRQLGLATVYRPDVRVPSIDQLTALFGNAPTSIAEIGVNRYLPLSEWPAGDVVARSTIAGRTLQMRLNPTLGEVAIDLDVPDRVASLTLTDVVAVEGELRGQGHALVFVRCADGATVTIQLRPDVSITFAKDCRSVVR